MLILGQLDAPLLHFGLHRIFLSKSERLTFTHPIIPVFKYNVRKIKRTDLEKR